MVSGGVYGDKYDDWLDTFSAKCDSTSVGHYGGKQSVEDVYALKSKTRKEKENTFSEYSQLEIQTEYKAINVSDFRIVEF